MVHRSLFYFFLACCCLEDVGMWRSWHFLYCGILGSGNFLFLLLPCATELQFVLWSWLLYYTMSQSFLYEAFLAAYVMSENSRSMQLLPPLDLMELTIFGTRTANRDWRYVFEGIALLTHDLDNMWSNLIQRNSEMIRVGLIRPCSGVTSQFLAVHSIMMVPSLPMG